MTALKDNLKDKTVVISIHVSTSGPGHDLRDYLLDHGVKRLLFIAHPLLFFKENVQYPSTYVLYENGRIVKKGIATHLIFPEHVLYIKDFFLSLYWTICIVRKHDIFFGVGNLNAFSGIILKRLGFCKEVIYYVIDFVPKRFPNTLINYLYHWIEKQSALQASWTWNLSSRMIIGREKKWGQIFPHQLVVPHGVHSKRIHRLPFEKIKKHEIIYMGTLLEKQGIQLVISALPKIKKNIKDVSFSIIGRGPYESELRKQVKEHGVNNIVHFLGYIENHSEMENRLARASVAVALYDKNTDIFSYYADPGKIKSYLGAGVPVVMTDVPFVAREAVENRCGFIVTYNTNSLVKAITRYFADEKMQRQFRENAVKFAHTYEWEKIFDKAFSHE